MPESRKDLMLDMRRSEEAEGERRMMGSGLRPGFLSREARVVVLAMGAAAAGTLGFLLRSLWKISEYLRTEEKS